MLLSKKSAGRSDLDAPRAARRMGWLGAGESDKRGDTGGENHEQQTDDDLVGCLRIVALPIPNNGPAGAEIHDPQPQKAYDGADGSDDLRHVADVVEQLLNGIG